MNCMMESYCILRNHAMIHAKSWFANDLSMYTIKYLHHKNSLNLYAPIVKSSYIANVLSVIFVNESIICRWSCRSYSTIFAQMIKNHSIVSFFDLQFLDISSSLRRFHFILSMIISTHTKYLLGLLTLFLIILQ